MRAHVLERLLFLVSFNPRRGKMEQRREHSRPLLAVALQRIGLAAVLVYAEVLKMALGSFTAVVAVRWVRVWLRELEGCDREQQGL